MADLYLGVEIGGTKQQIAVCDESGKIVRMESERVVLINGASDICAWIEKTIDKLLNEFYDVKAIGVGFGGPLESATGRVITSLHVPGWENFELKTWLEKKYPLPVTVVNDTVAGGYAELKLGSGRNSDKFFYTNIGTGIGGSLFVSGKTWDGTGYGGAYFGNTYTVDWTSDEKNAVERIEALCSGVQIEKRLRKDGYVPQDSMLMQLCGGDRKKIDCRILKKAAEEGDTFALEELDRIGHTFGMGVANLVTILSVDTVAIGGGVANLGDLILEPIRKYAEKYVFISGKDRFKVVQCELMDNNVPVGAALYARDGFDTI
ncbi:MAG: ROK family protein [Clostridia bacterium]|nr:ROK family protein [Clostridia bacterium]